MDLDLVPVRYTAAARPAYLRELNGFDVRGSGTAGTAAAIRLLDRLLVLGPVDGAVRPGQAAALTAADRDRLLAAVWIRAFGPRVESTVGCSACGARFDLDFELPALVAELDRQADGAEARRVGDGSYRLPDGSAFRLPLGVHECAAAAAPAAAAEAVLLGHCRVAGEPTPHPAALRDALERAAPILSLALAATCPECQSERPVHFDMQGYLLAALAAERLRLRWEVHLLARVYRWSPGQILRWSRSDRRAFVALIEAETTAARGSAHP
jgi:hypothetical protein